ncbi:MAG: hypothetical protein ABWY00_06985 [Dongiaceae bacterium]
MPILSNRPRPMFRGRDLTAGPVIGYGSQPFRRRRARIQSKRLTIAAVFVALAALSFVFGNSAVALLQNFMALRP